VTLDDGTAVGGDVVVIGLGAEPRLDLARQAGLEVSEGVVVDEHLRTSDPAIWAAGDIIEYPDAILARTRIEHVDHARQSGAAAGTGVGGEVVVIGLGAAPRLDLARQAGLEVSEGVVVDEHLRTSDPAIWAAGDIIEYPDAILARTRIEHVDHARESGAAAGRAVAGCDAPYHP